MSPNLDPADDIVAYNRAAWDSLVRKNDRWTIPVSAEEIQRARNDDWRIFLVPEKPIPREWFPDFRASSIKVLCLAGSGGQQAPILAAAGAIVTVLDNSPAQLAQDQLVDVIRPHGQCGLHAPREVERRYDRRAAPQ